VIARVGLARVRDDDAYAAAPAWLGADERARWTTLAPPRRPAFAASRRLLRELLAQATGVPADLWQVSAAAGAAPVATRLDRPGEPAPPVSLAHRLDWVAAAVGGADDGALGVDLECDRPARGDPAARAALVLAGDELARWTALPEDARAPALLRAWVAREAWFKAAGPGAPWDFRRLACEPADATRANVRVWEAGALRVALCAQAPAQATCAGWPEPGEPRKSLWHVGRR
jgi:phosphopantetheinyl transferase